MSNEKYHIYKNIIEDKEIYLLVFLNLEKDLRFAIDEMKKISDKNFTIMEKGLNSFMFIETNRTDKSFYFTEDEIRLSYIMFYSTFEEFELPFFIKESFKEYQKGKDKINKPIKIC